jgi:neutral ceramidase
MGNFKVGVAVSDITPLDEWIRAGRIWLWGYGSRTEACTGVSQPISARALVIQDEQDNYFVLMAVDIGSLDPAMTKSIRDRVGQSRDVSAEYICVNVSHTHGAPVAARIPTWQPGVDVPDNGYRQFLEDQIVAAVDAAFDNPEPATISFGRGSSWIGHDRHFGVDGYYDPTLDVLSITNDDGDLIASAFFYACHPVTLGGTNEVYADFPGVARAWVEQALGGTALFFQGYAGICNPGPNENDFGEVTANGQALGNDVIAVLKGPLDELDGPLDAWLSTIELPLQPLPSAAVLNRARAAGDVYARWANYMTSLGNVIPGTLPTQLQALRVGLEPCEWYLVASSHEVTTDFGDVIRAIWPYSRVTTMGYSNSQLSYLPSDSVLQNPPAYPDFPFCAKPQFNYEGGQAFAWYGHRAPLAVGVDQEFYNGHVNLLDPGWRRIGHANEVTAMTAWNGKLLAATKNNKLWWRPPSGEDIPWKDMGHAMDVAGLAAVNGVLYCATNDGKLWQRDPYGYDRPWQHIGHATNIAAMTALNGKLLAATKDGKLWQRDPIDEDIPWEHIGHAIAVSGMAAARDKLIAATADGFLHWRDPLVGEDIPCIAMATPSTWLGWPRLKMCSLSPLKRGACGSAICSDCVNDILKFDPLVGPHI